MERVRPIPCAGTKLTPCRKTMLGAAAVDAVRAAGSVIRFIGGCRICGYEYFNCDCSVRWLAGYAEASSSIHFRSSSMGLGANTPGVMRAPNGATFRKRLRDYRLTAAASVPHRQGNV